MPDKPILPVQFQLHPTALGYIWPHVYTCIPGHRIVGLSPSSKSVTAGTVRYQITAYAERLPVLRDINQSIITRVRISRSFESTHQLHRGDTIHFRDAVGTAGGAILKCAFAEPGWVTVWVSGYTQPASGRPVEDQWMLLIPAPFWNEVFPPGQVSWYLESVHRDQDYSSEFWEWWSGLERVEEYGGQIETQLAIARF
jgi:hypothetical protein